MNPFFVRHVFFPLYHYITGTGVMERLRELKSSQWLPRGKVIAIQQERLRLLLHHAYENIPFYRERFEGVGIHAADLDDPSVISSIPLLTKKEINENRDHMIDRNKTGGRLIPNSTSGSTGEALYFFTDMRSSACRRAVVIRNQEWIGVKLGDRRVSLWGAAMDIKKLQNIRGRIHRWFNNYIILSSYELSPRSLKEYIDRLNHFRPVLLISYPGPLTELAKFMMENDLRVPSIQAIISSAETLYPWQREISERAFSCPVYNRYGCREFGDIAHECEHREGLHINADRVYLEILDDELYPCEPGRPGEIVITDLDNYGMPFIRYRIGDRGTLSTRACSCGRGLPLLQGIEGRTLDVVRTPNGNALGGTFWTLLFRSRPGIKAFQVIQEDMRGIIVLYVRDTSAHDVPLDYFKKKIRGKCGEDFKVDFQEVKQIKKTTSGKTRFVISKLRKNSRKTE